ncbi:MAG: ATP cone domain-containing protein [Candidatus Paceibacterota bacterium]|jgi:ribonucleoside-diphosphate reductase alpha chain
MPKKPIAKAKKESQDKKAKNAGGFKGMKLPKLIRKRDGRIVPFDPQFITNAIQRAFNDTKEGSPEAAKMVCAGVVRELMGIVEKDKGYVPSVEGVQDIVEKELMLMDFVVTAKSYILFRERHAKQRIAQRTVPEEVRKLVAESKKYFKNPLQEYVYYTAYSKWIPEKGRREAWVETVERYMSFMKEKVKNKLTEAEYKEIGESMLRLDVLGSARLQFSAGPACRYTNICAYNCSYIAPTKWQDFGEIIYILMCGSGLGFSVERQTAEQFPIIEPQTGEMLPTHVVGDSKEGWADALVHGCNVWASGKDVKFDFSKVRPQGARLVTMGSRASGPEPLRELLEFVKGKILRKQGRHMAPIDIHDIVCKIGTSVVIGGSRRAALISLSDLDDLEMREAKNGQFYITEPQRSMANNSVAYINKPGMEELMDEWINLVKAGSGERGIYNRGSLKKQLPDRRWKKFEKDYRYAGMNPCGEIVLKSKQFCNLTQVTARPEDTERTLIQKTKIATILGTYQAMLTDFKYLSPEWKKNCEEEALLGVGITGMYDCPALKNPKVLRKMREAAIETNKKYAKRFGINESTAITCIKPSGNTSQFLDSSSGMHPRHAPYYIRRVRVESFSPVFHMMRDLGVPYHPEVGQNAATATTFVVEFPVKAPEGSVTKNEVSALDLLEYWKMIKLNYTEHNPSCTVSVSDDEWFKVGSWVYENWDIIGGLSFLPRNNHVYQLAPYEEITKERYEELAKKFPPIDFSKIVLYEYDDYTTSKAELACVAGVCEIDLAPVAMK